MAKFSRFVFVRASEASKNLFASSTGKEGFNLKCLKNGDDF